MLATDAYAELVRRSKETRRPQLLRRGARLGPADVHAAEGGRTPRRTDGASRVAGAPEIHRPRIGELLSAVEGSDLAKAPESESAANVREWRRAYDRATKIPQALVEELARVTTAAQQAWQAGQGQERLPALPPAPGEGRRPQAPGGGCGRLQGPPLQRADRGVRAGHHRRGAEDPLRRADPGARPAHPVDRRQSARSPTGRSSSATTRSTARSCSRSRRRSRSGSTSPPAGSTPPRIRSARASAPATAASPRATTRASSASRSSASSTRPATRSTSRTFRPNTSARRSASRARLAFTNRSRGCGRTRSVAAGRSGTTSSRASGRPSRPRSRT